MRWTIVLKCSQPFWVVCLSFSSAVSRLCCKNAADEESCMSCTWAVQNTTLCVVMRHWRSFLLLLFHHRTTTTVELINTTAVSMQLKDTLKWSNADAPTYFTTFIWRSISTSADVLAIAYFLFWQKEKGILWTWHSIQSLHPKFLRWHANGEMQYWTQFTN